MLEKNRTDNPWIIQRLSFADPKIIRGKSDNPWGGRRPMCWGCRGAAAPTHDEKPLPNASIIKSVHGIVLRNESKYGGCAHN